MTDRRMEGQESLFDLDIWSGRTSPEPSAATEEKTSRRSFPKSSGSQTRKPPMCLCLIGGGGASPDVSTMKWETGPLPIGCMTLSFGEFRSDESGLLYSLISTGFRRLKFCLTVNCTESPSIPISSRLSEILQTDADAKYNLSARACQGILNRAERRGKELPEELKRALMHQANVLTDGMSSQSISNSEMESQNPSMLDNADTAVEKATYSTTPQMILPSVCRETESTEPIPLDVTAQAGDGGVLHP